MVVQFFNPNGDPLTFAASYLSAREILHALAGHWSKEPVRIVVERVGTWEGEADTQECHHWIERAVQG